jgi:hypothetical protein
MLPWQGYPLPPLQQLKQVGLRLPPLELARLATSTKP